MTENAYDNESTPWPVNTILIANSMVNEIDEKRLPKKNSNVNVRCFNSVFVQDMFIISYH